jgi:hypothetical protein
MCVKMRFENLGDPKNRAKAIAKVLEVIRKEIFADDICDELEIEVENEFISPIKVTLTAYTYGGA